MSDEMKVSKEETLAELRKKIKELESEVAAKDNAIDEMKKKEEGWLVLTSNPMYNGTTMGVLFTDGAAFIPKNRVYTNLIPEPMTESQVRSSAEALRTTPEKIREEYDASMKIPTSQKLVSRLVNDFGYFAQFYTKDQMDELQKKLSDRARERKEAQDKIGSQPEMLEKLLVAHRM